MTNETQQEEQKYLQEVIYPTLLSEKEQIESRIGRQISEINESKRYIWQNIYEMDPIEIAANTADVSQTIDSAENLDRRLFCVGKLLDSAFFGRIDFVFDGDDEAESFYIGVHGLDSRDGVFKLIYDWRAPVSSLFYDYETGPAKYEAPMGMLDGEITAKRQYKIKGDTIEYMFNSSLNIGDEVLQKELSHTSDDKMKNIVATIQREQNGIIRNDKDKEMIIQGAAGSGKTSIALHRVAFLLYKHSDVLNSCNILIISPNNVFADYISDVLPELGEEKIMEMSFEDIADNELKGLSFQSFYDQVSLLLSDPKKDFVERISYKATKDFSDKLDAFLKRFEGEIFVPQPIIINDAEFSAEWLSENFMRMKNVPVSKRTDELIGLMAEKVRGDMDMSLSQKTRSDLADKLTSFFRAKDITEVYRQFLADEGREDMFAQGKKIEYSDVFPLIYVKAWFEGITTFPMIKHLLIDEMQDYTPIQYELVKKMFKCDMTILGDANQSVNPYSSTNSAIIHSLFPNARCLTLKKSYRSTVEITELAHRISPNSVVEPIERHGDPIGIYHAASEQEQIDLINRCCEYFRKSAFASMCIICKTAAMASKIFGSIDKEYSPVLINNESRMAAGGIVVTTAHMAKGLEFDYCVIPSVDADNYKTEIDKSMLYISVTRAMHKLDLICTGEEIPELAER